VLNLSPLRVFTYQSRDVPSLGVEKTAKSLVSPTGRAVSSLLN